MSEAAVREATLADAAALAALMTELGYPTHPTEMTTRLDEILADRTYAALVAERESVVLGVGGASLGRYFEKNGVYTRLVVLAVAEAHRGLGVGEALVRAVERWARLRGAQELFVNSGSQRHSAHRFYERCGFKVTGVRLVKGLQAAS